MAWQGLVRILKENKVLPILQELKRTLELYRISYPAASRLVGISQAQIYNWLKYERSRPGAGSQELIRQGLSKIRRKYNRPVTHREIKKYFHALRGKVKTKEGVELIELLLTFGQVNNTACLEKLKELAVKYRVKIADNPKPKKEGK
jgi:hypothetical protein